MGGEEEPKHLLLAGQQDGNRLHVEQGRDQACSAGVLHCEYDWVFQFPLCVVEFLQESTAGLETFDAQLIIQQHGARRR